MMPNLNDCLAAIGDVVVVLGLIERFAGRNAQANGDDELTAGCHDYILNAASDADRTGKGACCTGLNWRDQLSVQDAEALADEAALRRMPNRN
jgi:hypothetical protein